MKSQVQSEPVSAVRLPLLSDDVPLERDAFLRTLVRHLTGSLEDVIGLEEASGFVALVGQEMGEQIGDMYRDALALPRLNAEQVAAVLVDLKRRIKGDFYVVEQNDERIVLGNRMCPFGDLVRDRKALCMMTSNVFGAITARELGYARVELQETIAEGADGCRVVVHLVQAQGTDALNGREYHRGIESSEC